MTEHDWTKIRASVRRAAPGWYFFGRSTYSIAEAVRRDRITAMRGVVVLTRNTERRGGKRYCDIFFKEADRVADSDS